MRRVGLFGGTFDPVHLGHLGPALCALEAFAFDELVFLPAGRPPHKLDEELTPFSHRFAMLVLATQGDDRLLVSDLELEREGPTYTFDTLKRWRELRRDEELFFLMGSDSFAQISTWHRWQELVDLAHLVVLHRQEAWGESLWAAAPEILRPRLVRVQPGEERARPRDRVHRIYLLEHEPVLTSATHLRERLRQDLPVAGLVPPEVDRYIRKYGLYSQAQPGCHGR